MASYVARRVLIAIPVLLGISALVFLFVALAPGDAVSAYIPPRTPGVEQLREVLTRQLGLDQPLPVRYVRWLSLAVQGNLGYSVVTGLPVSQLLRDGLLASGALVGSALMIGIGAGIPLGVFSALRQYTVLDFALTGLAFLGISTPSFLLGLGALYIFGVQLRLVPIGGIGTAAQSFAPGDFLLHLILPAVVLGVSYVAYFMRYTRAAMLEALASPYITTAESKGLAARIVVGRHALRNALIPVVTVIGLSLPTIAGGAIILESVFAWPGMGSLLIRAVTGRDFPVIMGISLAVAVVVVIANLLTDVAYALIDPRIRY